MQVHLTCPHSNYVLSSFWGTFCFFFSFPPLVLLTFLDAVRNALPLALVCELLACVAEKTFNWTLRFFSSPNLVSVNQVQWVSRKEHRRKKRYLHSFDDVLVLGCVRSFVFLYCGETSLTDDVSVKSKRSLFFPLVLYLSYSAIVAW